uniref:Mannosyltransferase n=1 Tax=Neobodo designis TaxID=312471 RepID=A0A7S1LJD7_NEODS
MPPTVQPPQPRVFPRHAPLFTSRQALLFALAYRVIVALFIMRSADAPDEWYQSVEVAYHVVFGRGELTWEWREGIRSFLYPLPIAAGFWLLKVLGLDSAWAVFAVPRVYAGVICGLIDWCSYAVARKFMHPSVLCGQVAYALSLTAWYNVFMGCRTLTNVVEGLMLLAAFLPESLDGFLFFAGLGCGMRATFALPLVPNLVDRVRALVAEAQEASLAGGVARHMQPASPGERERVQRAAAVRCLVGIAVRCVAWAVFWIAAIAGVDYLFYKRWICTPWAFLHFNVFRGLSALFGVNPWWWYLPLIPFILGAPILLLLGLPAAMKADPHTFRAPGAPPTAAQRHSTFVRLVLVTVVVLIGSYSILPHKELRFIYPAVPPCLLLCAAAWVHDKRLWRWRKALVVVFLIHFVGFAGTTSLFWQQGPDSVMAHIRSAPLPPGASLGPPRNHRIRMLVPCHWSLAFSGAHELMSSIEHTNCTIDVDPATPPGAPKRALPMEHHLWIDFPLETAMWEFLGTDPAESHAIAERQRTEARFKADPTLFRRQLGDPLFETSVAEMPATLRSRVKPKSKRFPHRFVLFRSYSQWLEEPFLLPNGYEHERSVWHHPVDQSLGMDRYVEIWRRKVVPAAGDGEPGM